MRTILSLMIAVAAATPQFAQDPKAADAPAKPPEKVAEKPDDKAETPKVVKKEMSEEAAKLYADMELVYKKYYEIVLEATKADKVYDADAAWDTAVKESKNSTYKDRKEFFEAVQKMQKADKPFKQKSTKLVNDSAAANTKAINEWLTGTDKPKDDK